MVGYVIADRHRAYEKIYLHVSIYKSTGEPTIHYPFLFNNDCSYLVIV